MDTTTLKDIRSLVGKPLKLEVPAGVVSPEAVKLIMAYLKRMDYKTAMLPKKDFSWVWMDPKKGTLPKRLAKLIKKGGGKPDAVHMAEVGNIARTNSNSRNESYFFKVLDKIDWEAHQFGKRGGGCWWGPSGTERSRGLPQAGSYAEQFIRMGGLAAIFFSDDSYSYNRGIGRLWVAVEQTGAYAVCFNGYLRDDGAALTLSRVLATYLGLSYKKIESLNSPHPNYVYINNTTGYYIAPPDRISSLSKVAIVPYREALRECTQCLVPKRLTQFRGSGIICQACVVLNSAPCQRAGCSLSDEKQNMKKIKGSLWCGRCVSRHANQCKGCGKFLYKDSIKWTGLCSWCQRKAETQGLDMDRVQRTPRENVAIVNGRLELLPTFDEMSSAALRSRSMYRVNFISAEDEEVF